MKSPSVRHLKKLLLMYFTVSYLIIFIIRPSDLVSMVEVAAASPETTIFLDPSTVVANPDEYFTLNINISEAVDPVYSWGIMLGWAKPGLLECSPGNVTEGPFLSEGGTRVTFLAVSVNPTYIDVGCTLLETPPAGVTGSGILATVTFRVADTGNATLDLYETELTKMEEPPGVSIDHTALDGYFYTTHPVAQPIYGEPYKGHFYVPEPGHPLVNETLTFNASACYDPDDPFAPTPGGIDSYTWDFGDGGDVTTVSDPTITHAYTTNGSYLLTLNVTDDDGETSPTITESLDIKIHDIAIINATVSATEVAVGSTVTIDATVLNEGSVSEAINVTAYLHISDVFQVLIETKTDKSLPIGENKTISLTWNTTGFTPGTYTIGSNACLVYKLDTSVSLADVEEDLADNMRTAGQVTVIEEETHDIAVTGVKVHPTQVPFGASSSIEVTVKNEGNSGETFNLTVTVIHDLDIFKEWLPLEVTLDAGVSTTLPPFSWLVATNTTEEGNYTITAQVDTVTGELDTADNMVNVTVAMKLLPVASFEYSPEEPIVAGTVTFDASASYSPGIPAGSIVSYEWDFGDGTGDTGVTVTHVYHAVSNYNVTLTVTDDDDLTTKVSTIVRVLPRHDIAVTNVAFFPHVVIIGELVSVNVTVENTGDFDETFNVTVYYDEEKIDIAMGETLAVGANTTLTFTWDTTGVDVGRYTISAVAILAGEEDYPEDNTRIGGTATIEKLTSDITLSTSPTTFTVGASTTINGSIALLHPGVDLTIWHKPSGGNWSTLAVVITDAEGRYSYEWTPSRAGSYGVKVSWPGVRAEESDVQVIVVREVPTVNLFLYVTVGLAIVIGALTALVVYFWIGKPK